MHVVSAGVGKFALLVVVVFSFSLGMTFSYLLFFLVFTLCIFFLALRKHLFLCIRYATLTLGRTRGTRGVEADATPLRFF